MKRLIILNPNSNNGKAAQNFQVLLPDLQARLSNLDLYETQAPLDCTRKVREVLKSKAYDQILIAGGDGTVNEAVNGYFEGREFLGEDTPMGIIDLGTGGDFNKTLRQKSGLYDVAVKDNTYQKVDCGRVFYAERPDDIYHFINIASVGVSGQTLQSLKNSNFQMGSPAYFYHTIKSLIAYSPAKARIDYTDENGLSQSMETEVINFFVCNGRFNGGGMNWAPRGDIDDGLFDIVIIGGVSKIKLITESPKVYSGRISEFPGVKEFSAREIRMTPLKPMYVELDGEVPDLKTHAENQIQLEVVRAQFPLIL